MKIKIVSDARTIMSNPTGVHNYFGWPTVARLQDGSLLTVFYAHEKGGAREDSPAVIRQIIWKFE